MGTTTETKAASPTEIKAMLAMLNERRESTTIRKQAGATTIDLLALPGSIAVTLTETFGILEEGARIGRAAVRIERMEQADRHIHRLASMKKRIAYEAALEDLDRHSEQEALRIASPTMHEKLMEFYAEAMKRTE